MTARLRPKRPDKSRWRVAPKERRTADDVTFASRREMLRYGDLKLMERAGEISELELQPKFPMIIGGILVCTYIADFRYRRRGGKQIVEDAKGSGTAKDVVYKLKKKLLRALYGVEVLET